MWKRRALSTQVKGPRMSREKSLGVCSGSMERFLELPSSETELKSQTRGSRGSCRPLPRTQAGFSL